MTNNWTIPGIVDKWFREQTLDPASKFYLFYRPAPDAVVVICREADAPEGFVQASKRRISPSWTKYKAEAFVGDICRRLPIRG